MYTEFSGYQFRIPYKLWYESEEMCKDLSGSWDDTNYAIEIERKFNMKNNVAEGKTEDAAWHNPDTYATPDTGWQHITWPYLSQTNPDLALNKFLANDTKVQKTDTANTYWFINSMKELGVKTTDIVATGDCSAAVYYNKTTNKYTATVWNPTNKTKVVTFNNKSGKIGTATIGAKALVSFEVYKDKAFNVSQASTPEFQSQQEHMMIHSM